VCRSWIENSFHGMSTQRLVNLVLGNLVRLHYPGVVTLPRNGRRVLATTWYDYQFAPDGDYVTAHGVVSHDFWVSIFSIHYFFLHYPSVLMHFLFHILFYSYISRCPK
jgi:hypothetical protein